MIALTVVKAPPDLATIIAPAGAEVRATPSARDIILATARKSDLNILEKYFNLLERIRKSVKDD